MLVIIDYFDLWNFVICSIHFVLVCILDFSTT